MTILQLALDFTELKRAVSIAKEAEKYIDWIEVGTPLIKSEGMDAVRKMKKEFPKKKIVADMKIMDTGEIEVGMAAKAGADVVTVMGASDIGTVREAIEAGKRHKVKIVADVMGVSEERRKEVEKLKPDYICPHVGIDQQMRGVKLKEVLASVKTKIPLVAAGGITAENAGDFAKAGAKVIVVGGAITKAKDVKKAAGKIKKAIESKKRISESKFKKYSERELIKAFRKVSTSNLSDAMQRSGDLPEIYAVLPGVKMVGKAKTVATFPGDWAKPVEAIDEAKEGEVIVIDAGGIGKAVWGELATESAKRKKLAGVVVNGAIRDVGKVRKLEFPAFARHLSPTAGDPKGFGEIDVELDIEGVRVKPGDWIIGDDSGVVIVKPEEAVEVANRAIDIMEREERLSAEIKKGSTLSKVTDLKKWELKK